MRWFSVAIVLSVMVWGVGAFGQSTLPASQPSSQPVNAPTMVTIDLDNTTADAAITRLAEITALPMKVQSGRSKKTFSLHEKNRPLLDVIGDICVQGSCAPRNNYGSGPMNFVSTPAPPLGVYRPSDFSLLVLQSLESEERIYVTNSSSKSQSCNLQMTLIFDPAARVASTRGFDIDHVIGEDGLSHHNSNQYWNQPQLRFDALCAWDLNANVNVEASLGKKMSVFGVIRAYTLQDFVQLAIDDPSAVGKSFGNDELKCTIEKAGDDSSVNLKLEGTLIAVYGPNRTQQLFQGGTISGLDQNDQPLVMQMNVSAQQTMVNVTLRPTKRDAWKDGGPASLAVRVPRSAHQIEIPVELKDLTIR